MRKILLCVWVAACLAGVVAARDDKKKEEKPRPDLSGTWTLDRSKSDYGPFEGRPISKADATLVVSHRDPELKVTRTLRLNGQEETKAFAYFTDGRGETNPAQIGAGDVKSKTKWDGDKLVACARISRPSPTGPVDIETTEKWQVSSDSKTLTDTTTINGPFGLQVVKLVYRRGE